MWDSSQRVFYFVLGAKLPDGKGRQQLIELMWRTKGKNEKQKTLWVMWSWVTGASRYRKESKAAGRVISFRKCFCKTTERSNEYKAERTKHNQSSLQTVTGNAKQQQQLAIYIHTRHCDVCWSTKCLLCRMRWPASHCIPLQWDAVLLHRDCSEFFRQLQVSS